MSAPHDVAFAGAAVKHRLLTSDQVTLGTQAQKVLAGLGIVKSLAVVAVEARWMELDQASMIVRGLRKLGVDHPEIKPREATDADEAVLDRLTPVARKRLEAASRTLASLFYARGAGTLALDQGSPAAANRPARVDPNPTPAPVRRPKPVEYVEPPRKGGAAGAIIAVVAAVAAIVGFMVLKKGKPATPDEEDSKPVVKRIPGPPVFIPPPIVPAPPPKPPPPDPESDVPNTEPTVDPAIEARRKAYIEQEEKKASAMLDEVKSLLADGRPNAASGKLRQVMSGYGWTDYIKQRADEIAKLSKDITAASADMSEDTPEPEGEPVAETAMPAMAAAFKRLDDGAAMDARRAAGARTRLADFKADLVLRGGKIVKGAQVLDVTRDDLRVRGEIDGAKVDLLLAWTALEPASFLSVQKQIAKGQGAAGSFELGRAAVLRGLWKEARIAFDDCAKADAAWKSRLPDIAAALSDPAILRGDARRLGDGRLRVEYSFADAEVASDFTPLKESEVALKVEGAVLKLSGKELGLWSLRDLALSGDVDIHLDVEGPGQVAVAFGGAAPVVLGSTGSFRVERRSAKVRVMQGGRVMSEGAAAEGSQKLLIGAKGEVGIRSLWIAGVADTPEMTRRLQPVEWLEGGAHVGDFNLKPEAVDGEARARAMAAEDALDAGNLEEAWALAEESLSRSATSGLPIVIRGLIRLAQGEVRLAVADADLAMALEPGRGEVACRARRIYSAIRGASAFGAHRRAAAGPWELRTDLAEDRLASLGAKLDEATKRFAEAMKDAGPAPAGLRAAVFATRDACLAHLETADSSEVAVADGPDVEAELVRRAAKVYIRAAAVTSPGWFLEGMAAHLAGDSRVAEMKEVLASASPLDTLVHKPIGDFKEVDRLAAASFVRFLLAGPHKAIIPDLLKKIRLGVPVVETFSGKDLKKMDAEWRAWAAKDTGS